MRKRLKKKLAKKNAPWPYEIKQTSLRDFLGWKLVRDGSSKAKRDGYLCPKRLKAFMVQALKNIDDRPEHPKTLDSIKSTLFGFWFDGFTEYEEGKPLWELYGSKA